MRIKNMKRFITFLTILFIGISFLTNMFLNKVFSHEQEKYQSIMVSQGDTLWSIASGLKGNVNENIYNIKKLNNLDSSNIFIGQELVIPDYD